MLKVKKLLWGLLVIAFMQVHLSAMTTQGDRILNSDGQEIELKGVNWFGFNNQGTMVNGLWGDPSLASDFATIVYRMQLLGINAVRLPFSFKDLYNLSPQNFSGNCQIASQSAIQASVTNPSVPLDPNQTIPPMVSPPTRVAGKCNDYFPNDNTLNRFLWVVNFFAKNGFYVLIDNHMREDQSVLENKQQWVEKWKDLVTKISQDPISKKMLMIDILNEPDQFGIRWEAAGQTPGLKDLYISVMDAVYPINPQALFFVEGTGQGNIGANWGDGFATDPNFVSQNGISSAKPFFDALLTKPYLNQVVISPHVYPPSVTGATQNYSGPGLFKRLTDSFGYLTQPGYCNGPCKTFPVAIGEFGSRFTEPNDVQSLADFAKYLNNTGSGADGKHKPIRNWFYWSWNPNSSDTGGLVQDDWLTIIWKKIDYLATIGLKPWYTKSVIPVKTGNLCMTVVPVAGLAKSDLKPISINGQDFVFSDFNLSICKPFPVGSYTVTPPNITTSTMLFSANSQTVNVSENANTPVYITYVGTPIVSPTGDFVVTAQLGTAWQEDPSSSLYMNVINLTVKNNGAAIINVPWKVSIINSAYKAVSSYWNVAISSIQNGKINGQVKESWQMLQPHGQNSINFGLIVSSTSPNFAPSSILINDKPAAVIISN